jgi:acyl-CoA dehydrogenase
MNFDESPEEAAFRAACREFLSQHALRREPRQPRATMSTMAEDEPTYITASREWQRTKADAGWAGLTWPAEHDGRGISSLLQGIFLEEEAAHDVPVGIFAQAVGMAGPTIIAHGTPERTARSSDRSCAASRSGASS